jgi:hypothetical protein
LKKDASINLNVEYKVINVILDFIGSLLEGEVAKVMRSLGVVRGESLNDLLFLLFSSELLLVDTAHIILVHHTEIFVILELIRQLLLDNLLL